MNNEKKTGTWKIAAIHFLVAGFTIPLLASTAAYIALYYLGYSFEGVAAFVLIPTVLIISIWLGATWSSKYLARRYFFDVDKVFNISSTLNLVLMVTFTAYMFYGMTLAYGVHEFTVFAMLVITIMEVLDFYFVSKKYLRSEGQKRQLI